MRICVYARIKRSQRRSEKQGGTEERKSKAAKPSCKETSFNQPRRQREVVQGSKKGPGWRRRRFVGSNSCLDFVRTPRDSQTGPSFTRRLSQRGVVDALARRGKIRQRRVAALCRGGLVLSCIVLGDGGGWERQAKLARQKEQRRRMTRKIGFVRRDGPAWRTDFRKAVAFLAVSPRRTR